MQGWEKVTRCVNPLSMFLVLKCPIALLSPGRGGVTALKNAA